MGISSEGTTQRNALPLRRPSPEGEQKVPLVGHKLMPKSIAWGMELDTSWIPAPGYQLLFAPLAGYLCCVRNVQMHITTLVPVSPEARAVIS